MTSSGDKQISPVGLTALFAAAIRAKAAITFPLCDCRIDAQLVGESLMEKIHSSEARQARMLLRTAWIDYWLSCNHREQLVVLGSGFDTRYLRLNLSIVFELDLPEIVDLKLQRLEECNLLEMSSKRCQHLPCDLTKESFAAKLCNAGFDPSKPTVWLAEGVLMYLKGNVVNNVLREMCSLTRNTEQSVCLLHFATTLGMAEMCEPNGEFGVDACDVQQWMQQARINLDVKRIVYYENCIQDLQEHSPAIIIQQIQQLIPNDMNKTYYVEASFK